MPDLDLGWAWFDTGSHSSEHEKPHLDRDLAQVFARCFCGKEGLIVLEYLKSITQSRVLGPAASDALLRHMEGQRQLVAQIVSLVEQGRDPGKAAHDVDPARSGSEIMENSDD